MRPKRAGRADGAEEAKSCVRRQGELLATWKQTVTSAVYAKEYYTQSTKFLRQAEEEALLVREGTGGEEVKHTNTHKA
jgi:hypothetical protein